MCGIVGYVGSRNAKDVLLDSLELLEYRGYDSVGLAINVENNIEVHKCAGRVRDLRVEVEALDVLSNIGIGHTRWATHGAVNKTNAHPHVFGNVTLVHNGIIENYEQLIKDYELTGKLVSDTDTEVVAGVLDSLYDGDPFKAIRSLVLELKGTFALVIIFKDRPEEIYAIRHVSPIVATVKGDERMLASDLMAISKLHNRYFVVPEYTLLKMDKEDVKMFDLKGNEVEKEYQEINWETDSMGKNGYPFYMEKEIAEEPESVTNTFKNRIVDGLPDFSADNVPDSIFEDIDNITILACGTSWHAGLVCRYYMEKYAGVKTTVEVASEFIYSTPIINERTLIIPISQSGETIDTIEAVKFAQSFGAKVLAVINVQGSSMSRMSDYNIFTYAGPEIAVASTKAYTSQLSALYLIIAKMAIVKKGNYEDARRIVSALQEAPAAIKKVLDNKENLHKIASKLVTAKDCYMIGRGLDYYILLEASLKLKEISYIHSEAYASGELKHGTIALIEEGTPVIAAVTQEALITKELSNVKEVIARGAKAYGMVREDLVDRVTENVEIFPLPKLDDDLMVFPTVVAMQMLAYFVSSDRGYDVDKPRNLAKVVTVE